MIPTDRSHPVLDFPNLQIEAALNIVEAALATIPENVEGRDDDLYLYTEPDYDSIYYVGEEDP